MAIGKRRREDGYEGSERVQTGRCRTRAQTAKNGGNSSNEVPLFANDTAVDDRVQAGRPRTQAQTAKNGGNASSEVRMSANDTPVDDRVFPLMDLPAELRNSVYRACLTRPFTMLLAFRKHRTASPRSIASTPQAAVVRTAREISACAHAGSPLTANGSVDVAAMHRMSDRVRSAIPSEYVSNIARITAPDRRTWPQDQDPLTINLLYTSTQVYKEARAILYGDNSFLLDLETSSRYLSNICQQTRSLIKHLEIEFAHHSNVYDYFGHLVRLNLRFCWGLKTLVIDVALLHIASVGSAGSTWEKCQVDGFAILHWLPKTCQVILEGNLSCEMLEVIGKNANLASPLNNVR